MKKKIKKSFGKSKISCTFAKEKETKFINY